MDEPIAVEEQYDAEPTAVEEQYDAPESADETTASEQGADADQYAEPETSAADQYLANADSLRAAAAQYGEEAREAVAAIDALQAAQAEPSATTAATEAPATPAATASSSVGAVSPEPQIAAPESEAREIPVPDVVEGGAAVQSDGQSGDGPDEGSERPSEAMASVGMTVLPDTGGVTLGGVLGASLVACALVAARRFAG